MYALFFMIAKILYIDYEKIDIELASQLYNAISKKFPEDTVIALPKGTELKFYNEILEPIEMRKIF